MAGHCFIVGVFTDVLNICGPGAKPPHTLWDNYFSRGFLFILFFFFFSSLVFWFFPIVTASCFYIKKVNFK